MERKRKISLAFMLPGLLIIGTGLYIALTEAGAARVVGLAATIAGVLYVAGALILWSRHRGEIATEAETYSGEERRRAS